MHHESEGYDDETESYRRQRQAELNADAADRTALEQQYGQVWSVDELRAEFEVLGCMAPFVVVKRRSDGKMGSLEFQGSPRYDFSFKADTK
jgi:hypothetical protein